MPFCRECGKEVQGDWKSCPYCSSQIEGENNENQVQKDEQINDDNENNSLSQTTSKKSSYLFVYVAIGTILVAVFYSMSLGHSGEINYEANGRVIDGVNVWFYGGDAMNANYIEIKAYVNGVEKLCYNAANEQATQGDCYYRLYRDYWGPGEDRYISLETGCSYLHSDNCVVKLEIRYKGDLLSGSNKEITWND